MENELLKEAVEYGRAKVDSARPYCRGMGSKLSQPLSPGVACAVTSFSDEPMTGWMAAAVVTLMIRMCFSVYTMLSESCPRMVIVGYGRFSSDEAELGSACLRSMPNVFTGSCARMRCCLSETCCTAIETGTYRQSGCERSNQRWCSDGFRVPL